MKKLRRKLRMAKKGKNGSRKKQVDKSKLGNQQQKKLKKK